MRKLHEKIIWITNMLFLSIISFGLAGCVDTARSVHSAANLVGSGKALTQLYYTSNSIKDLRDVDPFFSDYDYMYVESLIVPRDKNQGQEIVDAFSDNLFYLVEEINTTTGVNLASCPDSSCGTRGITIQFKEKGYGENLAQRLFMGSNLRGTLYFIDQQNGTVLKEERLEGAKSYENLVDMIYGSLSSKMLKSLEDKISIEELMERNEKVSKIERIKPEHKKLLKKS